MKAAYRGSYGGPEVLEVKEIAVPTISEDQILVKVKASTVNRTDCGILTGSPWIIRFFTGLWRPTRSTIGTDFSGIIEKVGTQIDGYAEGDKVFGFNDNGIASHAEYLVLNPTDHFTQMPSNVDFQDAAASIEGFHYALNFINKVKVKAGDQIMLNGASGAIGSAMLQILNDLGAIVTVTCGTENVEKIKAYYPHKIIDYKKEDFTKDGDSYDFVFDAVGKSTFSKCKELLKENGVYISTELGPYSQNPLLALIGQFKKGKRVIFPVPVDIPKSLEYVSSMLEKGKFKPLIDRSYPIEEIRDAFQYVMSGEKVGNVILKVEG